MRKSGNAGNNGSGFSQNANGVRPAGAGVGSAQGQMRNNEVARLTRRAPAYDPSSAGYGQAQSYQAQVSLSQPQQGYGASAPYSAPGYQAQTQYDYQAPSSYPAQSAPGYSVAPAAQYNAPASPSMQYAPKAPSQTTYPYQQQTGYGYAPAARPAERPAPSVQTAFQTASSARPVASAPAPAPVSQSEAAYDGYHEEGCVSSYGKKLDKKAGKNDLNRKHLIAAAVIVAVLAITFVIAFAAGVFDKRYKITLADGSVVRMTQKELIADLTNDVIPEGIHINGIDVSGMTRDEALASIKANQPDRPLEINVNLVLNGKELPLDLSSLPIEVNDVEVVDKAFNYMRPTGEETVEELIAMHDAREALKSEPAEYQTAYTPNTADISAQVHGALDPFDHEAVDAVVTGFDLQSCQFQYTPSEQGYEIDIDKALNDVKDLLDGGTYTGNIEVDAAILTPYLTSTMIEEEFGLISTTSSSTSSSNSNRRNNIATAASSINGTILQNGESFSFNGTVGERTAANGYMEAGVIVDGATEQGYGGGVCQVSTMVYESAVKADLQINERHPHQWPARYADDGCDAAVDWGSQDLTFTNTSGYPIVISAYHDSSSSTISVAIYGHKLPDGEYIRFTGDSEVNTEYQTTYVQNPELPVGERNTTREGHNGLTAHSYKVRYDANGNEISRTEYTTYYNVINAEEEVGTLQPDGTQATFDATTGEVTTTETTTVDETESEYDADGYIIYEDDDETVYYDPGDDEDRQDDGELTY